MFLLAEVIYLVYDYVRRIEVDYTKSIHKNTYEELFKIWEKNLKEHIIRFPSFDSKDAVVLCYLYLNLNKYVSKNKLTIVINNFFGETVNDVQQARHLGSQKGWHIDSGKYDGEYCYKLVSVIETKPNWANGFRTNNLKNYSWESMKKVYGYKCATCDQKEGDRHTLNNKKIVLERGHMDPKLELSSENIIPQCNVCNKKYKNNFVFDKNGMVVAANSYKNIIKSIERISYLSNEEQENIKQIMQKIIKGE